MAYNNSCKRSILDLPVDLQVEVLVWLSPKVLLPVKCVCKPWFRLITDPSFAWKYCKRQYPILCSSSDSLFLTIDVNEPEKNRARFVRPLISLPDYPRSWKTTNVVNGLACIYQSDWQKHEEPIYLFNLTTRETVPLLCPPPPRECLGEIKFSQRQCHFGYDSGTKQYKLLHLWGFNCTYKKRRREDGSETERYVVCEVFSLGSDEGWRPIELSGNLICDRVWNILENSFCYDGSIYWILTHTCFGTTEKVITKFDVAQEKFDFIEFPQGLDPSTAELAQIRGQISLVVPSSYAYPIKTAGTATLNVSVRQITGKKKNGEPLWQNKPGTNWTIAVYPPTGCPRDHVNCSDFGLVSRVQQAVEGLGVVIVNCYDLASGKQFNLVVNNAYEDFQHGTSKFCSSQVVQNIIPLKCVVSSSSADYN